MGCQKLGSHNVQNEKENEMTNMEITIPPGDPDLRKFGFDLFRGIWTYGGRMVKILGINGAFHGCYRGCVHQYVDGRRYAMIESCDSFLPGQYPRGRFTHVNLPWYHGRE